MAYLLRGAHVVDPQVGLDDVRDVFTDGDRIAAVGEGLEAQMKEVPTAAQ